MQEFEAKLPGESRNYTMAFTQDLPQGATISTDPGAIEVDVDIYDMSDVDDPAAADMVDGSPALNADPVCIRGRQVGSHEAIIQPIKGGVPGATYVVTFTAKLTNGRTFMDQGLLPVSKYI